MLIKVSLGDTITVTRSNGTKEVFKLIGEGVDGMMYHSITKDQPANDMGVWVEIEVSSS